jgi:hypothetical protein
MVISFVATAMGLLSRVTLDDAKDVLRGLNEKDSFARGVLLASAVLHSGVESVVGTSEKEEKSRPSPWTPLRLSFSSVDTGDEV